MFGCKKKETKTIEVKDEIINDITFRNYEIATYVSLNRVLRNGKVISYEQENYHQGGHFPISLSKEEYYIMLAENLKIKLKQDKLDKIEELKRLKKLKKDYSGAVEYLEERCFNII